MKYRYFIIALTIPLLLGLGCSKTSERDVTLQEDARANAVEPDNAWKEYGKASAQDSGFTEAVYEKDDRTMRFKVPDGWQGEGSVWRPNADDKINYVRVQHFKNGGPMTDWQAQQDLDVHTVIKAEERENDYLLLVDHPMLKASILKLFIPDKIDGGRSYYLAECRIGFDADRPTLWNVCATFLDSLKVE
jgi:hypothetical protein